MLLGAPDKTSTAPLECTVINIHRRKTRVPVASIETIPSDKCIFEIARRLSLIVLLTIYEDFTYIVLESDF